MSWTYSFDPSTSDRDHLRFLIGDTDSSSQLFSNEELDGILAMESNVFLAGVRCAEALAARYARRADKTVGDLSITFSQLSKQFLGLAKQLKGTAATSSTAGRPYAGGISISDKQINETDTDVMQPRFKRDMHVYEDPTSSSGN